MAMWSRLMTVEVLVVVGVIGTFLYTYWFIRQKGLLKNLEQITEIKHALIELRRVGWSERAIKKVFLKQLLPLKQEDIPAFVQNFIKEATIFASTSFYQLIRVDSRSLSQEKAMALLEQCMNMLDFPEELSHGILPELLQKMDVNCPPHHPFWRYFAKLVDKAFPVRELEVKRPLNRQVHQLRYLISYQQAFWVRQQFGKGNTDWQALIAYLRSLPRWSYRLRESARLHNKQLFGKKNQKTLPVNMKILIHFHSEFILNQDGQFALILEERPHVNGVVNGASFNYARANNKRHRQLDMAPVGRQDPVFRKELLRSKMGVYLSPTRFRRYQKGRNEVGWEQSYFNQQGSFSYGGHSRAACVANLRRRFAKDIGLKCTKKQFHGIMKSKNYF
ncbi:DUF3114 domain-containing protein [Streptococcus suis]|nr:DUF3114 domain-containing protein [Streptococcus suis]HEM2811921.1 DUF3114 domain-containing protein [Streptococcus suis]HEM4289829.1 DUF3114 domain-containing protein [Streptococcus suis]